MFEGIGGLKGGHLFRDFVPEVNSCHPEEFLWYGPHIQRKHCQRVAV